MRALGKIEAKKSLGQHFLNNPHIPRLMADAGCVGEGDTVLEIGPGTGVLTRELLARGARVIAVEVDDRAIASLEESFRAEISAQKLVISKCDVSSTPIASLGVTRGAYKVVANIPYYLSGKLFRAFFETEAQPSCLVFLVQREVGERIARDTKESLLSLSVKVFGTPRYVKTVARGNFTPPPKVDSAIISVSSISRSNFTQVSEERFFELIHAGFAAKRKQLFGNLSKIIKKEALTHTFSTLNLSPKVRAEDVPLATWLRLTELLPK